MLSGETAGGLFPLEAVRAMAAIAVEAERCIEHAELFAMVRVFFVFVFFSSSLYVRRASTTPGILRAVRCRPAVGVCPALAMQHAHPSSTPPLHHLLAAARSAPRRCASTVVALG